MNKKTPEGIVVKAIAQYLELLERKGDCYFFRVRNMSFNANRQMFIRPKGSLFKNGIPDICGVYKGVWVGFEVKADTKQSESQKMFEAGVKRAGGVYCVVRSVDDVVRALALVKFMAGVKSAVSEGLDTQQQEETMK